MVFVEDIIGSHKLNVSAYWWSISMPDTPDSTGIIMIVEQYHKNITLAN